MSMGRKEMTIMKFIVPMILIATMCGCVMIKEEEWGKFRQDIGDLQKDAEDTKKSKDAMRQQIENTRAALETIKGMVQEVQKGTTAQLSDKITASEAALTGIEKELRKKQADMAADITAIRSDFQVLTGRFEEARYAIQKNVQDEKGSREEIELRLKDTAQKLEEMQKRIGSLEQGVALLKQEREQGKEQAKDRVAETSVEDAYKDAYETYQRGDYAAAREKFQRYLDVHPAAKYSENALYWIGESFYSEKNYEKAIVLYDDVVKKYPDGGKAPAALLKQGMAFSALGDRKNANAIFKKVVERYPKSEQAEVAKKRMRE